MTLDRSIRMAFFLSGVAGLVYEVLWSRYLALFVGNGAFAQVLVLAVYLGGMAVGSLAVAERSRRLDDPLRWYAGAEAILAVFGLVFHLLFVGATTLGYEVLFPAVGSAGAVGALRWGIAGLLILPQAIVLGATFPLMAAGLVRADAAHPGGGVAQAYLLNTFGAAAGVLLAGFLFIGWFGLPGTAVAAAVMNLGAAGLVMTGRRRTPGAAEAPVSTHPHILASEEPATGVPSVPVLLTVAFGTAVASFAYEIGWIRMLSLLLGSATHAFELMLSAFILGIALGALAIRGPSDRTTAPARLLGIIQVLMGMTALLSLPVYLASFDITGALVRGLAGQPGGYALFNVGRYALALVVMLPSTVLAGMTLPLITGMAIRAGGGEGVIGRVYGLNTIGSVVGAGVAGLIALPALGLEGLVTAGAALDVALGLWVLERSTRRAGLGRRRPLLIAVGSAIVFVVVARGVDFDPATIASGVYRSGAVDGAGRQSLYYQDGRTATVSAHLGLADGVIVLATNGKPDASLAPRWIAEGRDTMPERPIEPGGDFTTQVLAPGVALAHNPDARTIANIGHGSGMTAASFLTSSTVERLVTIEIEPMMVEGSLVFLPVNGPAFTDPRVTYVFDDAKSYFSYRQERFDVIFAEPSNPWVSGAASLFTKEFYSRIRDFLAEGGILAQWMQLYELDDDLFLSVLGALDAVFPSYRVYLIGDSDVAIVAGLGPDLPPADWSVLASRPFRALTAGAPAFLPQHMDALLLFDSNTMRPVLDGDVAVNSDFHPVLDLGAERARFEGRAAEGTYSFAASRVDLAGQMAGRRRAPVPYSTPPAYGLAPIVRTERGAWLREALAAGGGRAPEDFPQWEESLVGLQLFFGLTALNGPVGGWEAWAIDFFRAENVLHWGVTDWVDPTFYENVFAFLDRVDAPAEPRAVVDLMHGYQRGDWPLVAGAADRLVPLVAAGEDWVPPEILRDIAVLAYLRTGRRDAAESVLAALSRASWSERDLRIRLLRALVEDARRESP